MTVMAVADGDVGAAFLAERYVRLNLGIGPQEAERLCSEILGGSVRRVYVDENPETWAEHEVADHGALARLMTSARILALARAALGRKARLVAKLWGNVYKAGEMIPWHTDNAGVIQLLLCLRPPPPRCGGEFLIRRQGKVRAIGFRIGDAILFKATDLEHSTTQLVATAEHPAPSRIVAVSRFYETAGDRRPDHLEPPAANAPGG